MKIACVVSTFPPFKGGIGNAAYNFSHYLASENNDVTVFTPRCSEKEKGEEPIEKNIKIIRLKPFFKFGNSAVLPQLIFLLKKYDVIYLQYPFFGGAEYVMFGKLFFARKTKLIVQYHMDNYALGIKGFIYNIYKILVLPWLLKMSDIINVATIDYTKSTTLAKYYNKKREKFRETYYGIDSSKFFINYHSKGKRLLFVGGLSSAYHPKGLDVLFEAIKILKDKDDIEVKLDIVGNGDLKKKFIDLSNKMKINYLTNFTENVSDEELIGYYSNCLALILPAKDRGEAFGIVLLEAMASGKPVIASNLAGVRSVFEDGKQGLLVKPNDPKDLAEKIKYLWQNPEKSEVMGRSGRELVEKKYDSKIVSKNINKIFNELKYDD